MSSGRSGSDRRAYRGPAHWLLGALLVLAVAASIALIFSDSHSVWASVAVVAALWAAVIGAILVTMFRRQAESADAKVRDLRTVYELQLEREVSARRHYESGIEAQVRREIRAESDDQLRALQDQVYSLRASLQLLIGDLPDHQVSLEAQRLRELDQAASRFVDDGAAANRDFAARAADAQSYVPESDPESMTDVIGVVDDAAVADYRYGNDQSNYGQQAEHQNSASEHAGYAPADRYVDAAAEPAYDATTQFARPDFSADQAPANVDAQWHGQPETGGQRWDDYASQPTQFDESNQSLFAEPWNPQQAWQPEPNQFEQPSQFEQQPWAPEPGTAYDDEGAGRRRRRLGASESGPIPAQDAHSTTLAAPVSFSGNRAPDTGGFANDGFTGNQYASEVPATPERDARTEQYQPHAEADINSDAPEQPRSRHGRGSTDHPVSADVADTTAAWATTTSQAVQPSAHQELEPDGAHANGRSVAELMSQFGTTQGGRRRRRED